jgi:hypothetical protein
MTEALFKNSLVIHEENTKKNHKRVVSSDIEMPVSSRIMQIIVFAGFLIHPVCDKDFP